MEYYIGMSESLIDGMVTYIDMTETYIGMTDSMLTDGMISYWYD